MSKVAVVTGASAGLGREIALRLQDKGFIVRNIDKVTDVRNPMALREFAAKIEGKIDVLVNNAGVNELNWIEDMSLEDLVATFAVNVGGIFNCVSAFLPKLANGGTVLNVTSVAAHIPMTCSLSYNASKAAAEMMTRTMARELFPRHGVTVFGVSPSKLKGTAMSDYVDTRVPELRGWTRDEAKAYQAKSLGTGREIPVYLVAEFIGWLLSKKERHEYLNGCILPYGL